MTLGYPFHGVLQFTTVSIIPTTLRHHHGRYEIILVKDSVSGFGGLEVACWPLVPKFAGSNTAEAVGFFRAKKSSARLPSEGK